MTEEHTPYNAGQQLRFLTVIEYIPPHFARSTKDRVEMSVETTDGIAAARTALDALESLTAGGKITTIMMSVTIDRRQD